MEWSERIAIDRPLPDVHSAIANQHEFMAWSAWSEAAGYTCVVDGDGVSIGSEIVCTSPKGVEQGRQRLTTVLPRRIEYRLRDRGPAGREMTPEVDFLLEPLDDNRTQVELHFRNEIPLPWGLRHLLARIMTKRIRGLHAEDLRLLKEHVESGVRS